MLTLAAACSRSRVPNLQAADWYWSGPVRKPATQQEVSLNITHLNHPETIPPTLVCGKIVFQETSPWCQRSWGLLFYIKSFKANVVFVSYDITDQISFFGRILTKEGTRVRWRGTVHSQSQNKYITTKLPGRVELGVWMLYKGFKVDNPK